MPKSRSRERERRHRSRDRRSRSKSRERRKSRDRSDYKRRDRSPEKYSSSSKRDKYDSHKRRSRDRSYERSSHRNKSSERDRKRRDSGDKRRSSSRSKRQRSNSLDKKTSHSSKSQSNSVKPIVIIANHNKKSSRNRTKDNEASTSNNNAQDHRASFEISNEFSQEGFEQFGRDHGIDFTNIETDEDRVAVHEKMEELLKAHFAAQGKVYPPPKVEKPVVNNVTGFANDGSFLEQFKKMQEEYKQKQETDEKKKQTIVNNLKNLPINKRRGGKILKTGLVSKTIVTAEGTITTNAYDSYYKEVQKYKNSSSCDSSDSKTRPLVK